MKLRRRKITSVTLCISRKFMSWRIVTCQQRQHAQAIVLQHRSRLRCSITWCLQSPAAWVEVGSKDIRLLSLSSADGRRIRPYGDKGTVSPSQCPIHDTKSLSTNMRPRNKLSVITAEKWGKPSPLARERKGRDLDCHGGHTHSPIT